jgi:hypothetical protein
LLGRLGLVLGFKVEKIELGARLKDEAELLLGVEVAELSWYFL